MNRVDTKILKVDADRLDPEVMEEAAKILRANGLVAFPTETVYGLGALALSPKSVEKIFVAKGRPATNPLIVHVAHIDQAIELVAQWPDVAQRLAEAFWPGPLTLVLRRSEVVPDAVCAGLDTVAIRLPAHPVARRLIETVGEPLAAPSANRSTEVSPTTAQHVMDGLDGRIDLVIDAGSTEVGLESTLVTVVQTPLEILRPGMITRRQVIDAVGEIEVADAPRRVVDDRHARSSPGLSKRHYAPGVPLRLVDRETFRRLQKSRVEQRRAFIGIAAGSSTGGDADTRIWLPLDADRYGRRLYAALHRLERLDIDEIIVELPPKGGAWEAIHDRLRRAAASPSQ